MIQKFIKKCEEFVLCGGYGEADGIFTDGFPDNHAIYHIIIKGSVKKLVHGVVRRGCKCLMPCFALGRA